MTYFSPCHAGCTSKDNAGVSIECVTLHIPYYSDVLFALSRRVNRVCDTVYHLFHGQCANKHGISEHFKIACYLVRNLMYCHHLTNKSTRVYEPQGSYSNCSCIEVPRRVNGTQSTATNGFCGQESKSVCLNIIAFLAFILIILMTVFLSAIPNKTVVLR